MYGIRGTGKALGLADYKLVGGYSVRAMKTTLRFAKAVLVSSYGVGGTKTALVVINGSLVSHYTVVRTKLTLGFIKVELPVFRAGITREPALLFTVTNLLRISGSAGVSLISRSRKV